MWYDFIDDDIKNISKDILNSITKLNELSIFSTVIYYNNIKYLIDIQVGNFRIVDSGRSKIEFMVEYSNDDIIYNLAINQDEFYYRNSVNSSRGSRLYFIIENNKRLFVDDINSEEDFFQFSVLNNLSNHTYDDVIKIKNICSDINYTIKNSLNKDDLFNIINMFRDEYKRITF